jgi:hypothetical protein
MSVNPGNIPKIHLLMSVYLTDESLYPKSFYNNYVSKSQNKVEQFLSVIYSLKSIQFSAAEIHYEVSDEYQKFVNVINNQIKLYIPNAIITSKRLEYFNEWQQASRVIPSDTDTILLKTNHDHAFLHEDASLFYRFIKDVITSRRNYIGEISHWPEAMGGNRSSESLKSSGISKYYSVASTKSTIGTCLVNPEFFKSWWTRDFTNGSRIVRPDNPFGPSVYFESVDKVIPNCEFFRHMDGYGHQKIMAPIASPIRSIVSISEDKIQVSEWTKGNFFLTKKQYDLPPEPKLNDFNSIRIYINLALLASTYRFSIKNLWRIGQAFEFKSNKYLRFCSLLTCFTNRHFVGKLFTQFARIESIKFRTHQLWNYLLTNKSLSD